MEKQKRFESNNQRYNNKYSNRNNEKKDKNPQEQLNELIKMYFDDCMTIFSNTSERELEVKFGTLRSKQITKIDFDNVIQKLKSLGFVLIDPNGEYLLRITNQYIDKRGKLSLSNIRAEINGFQAIQSFCKHNDINKLMDQHYSSFKLNKKSPMIKDEKRVESIDFHNFQFRVSYQNEEIISNRSLLAQNIFDKWGETLKFYRYIHRISFQHEDFPFRVDMSIVKSSVFENGQFRLAYNLKDSGVLNNVETYEIEIEMNNRNINYNSKFNTYETVQEKICKGITMILSGIQNTNYPVSYYEQNDVLVDYMKLIFDKDYNPEKRIYSSNFIGPSSLTLQLKNIVENDNLNVPNIRNDYTVTDKADGDRALLFITDNGKIYLISSIMNVMFTGAVTENKKIFNTLIDGELILHDKRGEFINLFAAFDIYYISKENVKNYPFMFNENSPKDTKDQKVKFRYNLLKEVIEGLTPKSVVNGELSPISIIYKQFYPKNYRENIFESCNTILSEINNGMYRYNTDGLIFTPAHLPVGSDSMEKSSPNYKTTWRHSFKWKPSEFNTIDFLVTTEQDKHNQDVVKSLYENGVDVSSLVQFAQYKVIKLRCGFNESEHGYINPCQDLLDEKYERYRESNERNENQYKPLQFIPTNPYDINAGVANIMLKMDDSNTPQMYTEEGDVFQNNTIVEFKYNLDKEEGWRWEPLRVRYDKTAEYKNGGRKYGNDFSVANDNWYSIHNPITEEMIKTGDGIPSELVNDDIYYNRITNASDTKGLRDFHNLFVKSLLIRQTSSPGNILIDFACGKGGDFPKWIKSKLSFVFGIDISKDNLENRKDGACARYLNFKKEMDKVPSALFAHGNTALNIKNGNALFNEKAIEITKSVFGLIPKNERMSPAILRNYGKGHEGFHVSSCQFAIHYFFENKTSLHGFMRNVSECTKVGGYFIGTSYDGKLVFNKLKNIKEGESIPIYKDRVKIWEIVKNYSFDDFPDDKSSVGYKISVYQETINQLIPEFLVNFDYLNQIMENYGFRLMTREESKQIGLPNSSGYFNELFGLMMYEIKSNKYKEKEYGEGPSMKPYEKEISFLNRYFVYKKIRDVDAQKIAEIYLNDEESEALNAQIEEYLLEEEEESPIKISIKEVEEPKPKIKRISKKTIIIPEKFGEQVGEQLVEKIKEKKPRKVAEPKPKKQKVVEVLPVNDAIEEEIELEIEDEKPKEEEVSIPKKVTKRVTTKKSTKSTSVNESKKKRDV